MQYHSYPMILSSTMLCCNSNPRSPQRYRVSSSPLQSNDWPSKVSSFGKSCQYHLSTCLRLILCTCTTEPNTIRQDHQFICATCYSTCLGYYSIYRPCASCIYNEKLDPSGTAVRPPNFHLAPGFSSLLTPYYTPCNLV